MIVQVLGSNGAGKSSLVRAVLRDFPHQRPEYVEGRKKPICIVARRRIESARALVVIGHYDIANGGGDTIQNKELIQTLVYAAASMGNDVLVEGPTGREAVFYENIEHETRVVWLQPPEIVCYRSVISRGHNMRPDRVTKSRSRCARIFEAYRLRGCHVTMFEDRTEALHHVQATLRDTK